MTKVSDHDFSIIQSIG